jgi:hypothetical protein
MLRPLQNRLHSSSYRACLILRVHSTHRGNGGCKVRISIMIQDCQISRMRSFRNDRGVRLLCQATTCCIFLLNTIALFGSEGGRQSEMTNVTASAPSPKEVSKAIALATGYLERACGPDGKFAYKVDIGSGRESSSYDIIRHAGAMYALAMANRSHPDPEAVAALIRAAKFLRRYYIGPAPQTGQEVVWSQPLTETIGGPRLKSGDRYAELGDAGLGLVALAAARQLDPASVPLERLQALGRFAIFLQREDGSFVHKYRAAGGAVPRWQSLYYPGEAALGFIALYEADHSPEWLTAAGKALSYLAKSRTGLTTVPADHWALIATAKLLPYCEKSGCAASREELVRHAIQVCESILGDQFKGSAAAGLDGAFDATGRTAPTATRLEGLLASLEFLPKGELRNKIEAGTERGIAFLLRAQVVSGAEAGGMPGTVVNRAIDSSEIRIDYVQHALCAWLRYQKLVRIGANSDGRAGMDLSFPFHCPSRSPRLEPEIRANKVAAFADERKQGHSHPPHFPQQITWTIRRLLYQRLISILGSPPEKESAADLAFVVIVPSEIDTWPLVMKTIFPLSRITDDALSV